MNADELFPSEQIKDDLIAKSEPNQFAIAEVGREIAGLVNAKDVIMKLSPSKVDQSNTRIDVDIQGNMVEIDGIFTKKYSNVDVDGIYDSSPVAPFQVEGMEKWKVAPLPLLFSAHILPPWASIIAFDR